MDFVYTAYTEDKKLVKGKVSSTSEEAATELLSYGGYRVIRLKKVTPLLDKEKLLAHFSQIKTQEIVMFSRQLALLLESGTDIVTSLDLLQDQIANQTLRRIIAEVASDIRGGSPLSSALSKHPRAFSPMYSQAIAAGEQGGNLEVVLRQMADYMERGVITEKKIKGALTYPFLVVLVAVVVVAILITFVFPSFVSFYAELGVELPLPTRILIGITDWASHYGVYLLIVILAAVGVIYAYIKTPAGKYHWHKMMLRLPVVGRIVRLSELSRCCRTMSLLIRVGLPLPEVMAVTIRGTTNKAVEESLTEVQQALIRGEGLAQPMAKRELFLPLMTQMVKVGEETGNLENTLVTVAESFETEADDKTNAAVGLIQPVITVLLGLGVGFVVLAMLSAMYSVYGQLNL
ncbi:MAG: type II secretion system F family protein [Chloroflexi bacterium]|nr:MAG: type II secretion system F family protein [Chloroflexota bacterium]